MATIKIIVEKHADGYVAYPLGVNGAVVGQGESYEAALADAPRGKVIGGLHAICTQARIPRDDFLAAYYCESR